MAFVLVTSACSVFSPSGSGSAARIREVEVLVWNDSMPGSRPRCNATLRVTVTNPARDTLFFTDPEMQILDALSGQPVRRFPAALLLNDTPARTFGIAPGDSIALNFRSPSWGVEPIDLERYPTVRISVRMTSTVEKPLHFTSSATTIFETQ